MNAIISPSRLGELLARLERCNCCPRNCGVNRLAGETGVCGASAGFEISTICAHKGEEPVISGRAGICNVFFNRCNLQCVFCQNHQISSNRREVNSNFTTLQQTVDAIIELLKSGCRAVGFVSPSHVVPQVKAIIESVWQAGYSPVFVYNTNAYDRVEELAGLESYIDVYLPDYKYSDNQLARKYSKVADYQEVARAALREMYRQKGSTLLLNNDGYAEKGIIVRHLVLPGHVENSLGVLNNLADISTSLSISLMAQYYPTSNVLNHPQLNRTLSNEEYQLVCNTMENLGFYKGWVQELESQSHYRPDFEMEKPFEG